MCGDENFHISLSVALFTVAVFLAWVVASEGTARKEARKVCEAAGGVQVQTHAGYACVKEMKLTKE